MSYANWFGTIPSITDNTTLTTVSQNGSNYTTTINVVPSVVSRSPVLSTMVDEVNTVFFSVADVPPGLYKAGMYFQCGTGAADPWQARDFLNFFVASDDFLRSPTNSNAAQFYKTRNSTVTPFTEGFDPIAAANGSVNGQHTGYLNISSIQKVNFVAYMEDFADNPVSHAVFMADPWLQKIG